MRGVGAAPATEFFEFQFAFHFPNVLMAPVVIALALRALESDEVVLRHGNCLLF